MTVKELKESLSNAPDDVEVIMADEESVVFAEMVDGFFVVSDRLSGDDGE